MSQDEQIGAGVKQQEETQEGTQGTDENLLGDGMNLWDVHIWVISDGKSTGFSGDAQIICFMLNWQQNV
jgi:hypothetical protein